MPSYACNSPPSAPSAPAPDTAYSDPIGEAVARPRTAAVNKRELDDDWADEGATDMLPE